MQILLIYIALADIFPGVYPSFFAYVSMYLLLTLQSQLLPLFLSSLVFFAFPDGLLCFLTSPLLPLLLQMVETTKQRYRRTFSSVLGEVRKRQRLKSSQLSLVARQAGEVEEMYGGAANCTAVTLLQTQCLRETSYVPDVKNSSWAGTAVP